MAEPSLSADVSAAEPPAAPAPRSRGASPTLPRAGVVTAGDIDDGLNFAAFQRYAARAAKNTGLPQFRFGRPVMAKLTNPDGTPAPGVRVTLRTPGAAEAFYDGYSGVDGAITVFPAAHGQRPGERYELRAFDGNGAATVQTIGHVHGQQLVPLAKASDYAPQFLDLVFVVDTTGSMGDELAWLTRELRAVVRQATREAGATDIRYGLIVYRDVGDEYVVRQYNFTKSASTMTQRLRKQEAMGGGDYPEAAAAALRAAAGMNWRRGNGERLVFHIADAPPHSANSLDYLTAASQAAQKGVQVYTLGASGVATESEYLMRQASLITNGRYLFLTDDSGVGNPHAEPNISCYRVTALKNLMRRVLVTELTGIRQEASSSAVIREVGTYKNGVCRD